MTTSRTAQSLSRKDSKVLCLLADCRLLSVSQLTALEFSSRQLARRWIRQAEAKGFIRLGAAPHSGSRGRPESVISLSEDGIRRITESKSLNAGAVDKLRSPVGNLQHQLLLNDCAIKVREISKQVPNVVVQWIASTAVLNSLARCQSSVRLEVGEGMQSGIVVPDGTLTISDHNLSLLVFVEIDRATEPLVSKRSGRASVREKIVHYREILVRKGYKVLETLFGLSFSGFRVLLIAECESRNRQLAKLVRSESPSEFVWTTNHDALMKSGFRGAIWSRGGNQSKRESLLGKYGVESHTLETNL